MSAASERYTFLATHHDKEASLLRNFYLFYYLEDKTVSLYDIDRKKTFLKRILVENVTLDQIYIGSSLIIMSRNFAIADYGDEYTRKQLGSLKQKTCAILKPEVASRFGEILNIIIESGYQVSQMKMVTLTSHQILNFYKEHTGKPFMPSLVEHMSSGPCVALELLAQNAVTRFQQLLGPTDPEEARKSSPNSLRAKYGADVQKNVAHCSGSANEAERELDFFFSDSAKNRMACSVLRDSALCLIKPHSIKEHSLGKIIDDIQKSGLQVTAMQMFYLEVQDAREFFQVYEDIVPEYLDMVDEITSGPCVAVEVRHPVEGETPVSKLKKLAGPRDPAIAKILDPDTLRAKYGKTKVLNAVHCTDLEEDVMPELEYFFTILQRI